VIGIAGAQILALALTIYLLIRLRQSAQLEQRSRASAANMSTLSVDDLRAAIGEE
jgi:hypothetical protein